jgi:hypothetical protein
VADDDRPLRAVPEHPNSDGILRQMEDVLAGGMFRIEAGWAFNLTGGGTAYGLTLSERPNPTVNRWRRVGPTLYAPEPADAASLADLLETLAGLLRKGIERA